MFLLKFIFLFLIAIIVIVLLVGYSFVRQLLQTIRRFGGLSGQGKDMGDNASHSRQRPNADGNVVIDRRNPQHASRKIIADDEGEYVDYEESK